MLWVILHACMHQHVHNQRQQQHCLFVRFHCSSAAFFELGMLILLRACPLNTCRKPIRVCMYQVANMWIAPQFAWWWQHGARTTRWAQFTKCEAMGSAKQVETSMEAKRHLILFTVHEPSRTHVSMKLEYRLMSNGFKNRTIDARHQEEVNRKTRIGR